MRLRDFRRLRSEVSKSPIHFHTALGESILRLWRGPSPRAYSWRGFTLFPFHSASRIHPVPLTRPFSKGLLMERIHSLFLSFRLQDPSCAFDAPFSKGLLMERIHSLFLSFHLEDPSCAFDAPFSKGLLMKRTHSLFLSFRLGDPSCAFGSPLLQEPAANSPKRKRASFR